MTQRTGGKLNAGQTFVRHMTAENGSVRIMFDEVVNREETALRQRRVHACTRVSFAQNKAITIQPVRFVRLVVQDMAIQDRQHICHRKTYPQFLGAFSFGEETLISL